MSDVHDTDWSLSGSPHVASSPSLPSHLYVHVPFCTSKCDYCDFASVAGATEELVATVFTALRSQVVAWEHTGLQGVLDTIYVGGGTPSLHFRQVAELLELITTTLVVHPSAEITVEGNPDSLSSTAVKTLASAGANRVSIGVQSFDDHDLRVLGRCHDSSAAAKACDQVLDRGLALSIDLMCAIPGQSRASWAENLRRAADTGAGHVSVYPLAIEENTPLQVAVDNGLLEPVDADDAADLMVIAEESLRFHGLERYEVANYARSLVERSRHNTAYWSGRPYIGLGPGAHSMLDGATARVLGHAGVEPEARVRLGASRSIEGWLTGELDELEILSAAEARREDVMLGMRRTEGVTVDDVDGAGLSQVFASLKGDGLVKLEGHAGTLRWRTTRRGWLLGNEVYGRIWNADE